MQTSVTISKLHSDFLMRSLQTEIIYLEELLKTLERSDNYEQDYICESLKVSETKLRALRKSIV